MTFGQDSDYLAPAGWICQWHCGFHGGIVDFNADSIYVARSCGDVGSGGNFTTGTGTLIVERGTVDAEQSLHRLQTRHQRGDGDCGTVTLKSNVTVTVNHNVALAFRNNVTNGPVAPIGALAVNDNATLNVGGNLTHGDGAVSSLSLGGGTINMTGSGNVYTYGLGGFGAISGANNITVTNNFTVVCLRLQAR